MEFRLLVETGDSSSQPALFLEGRHWTLSQSLDLENDKHIPPFACISYVWGSGREPHAMIEGLVMSTRTCSSLAAAIRIGSFNAFWTDVFCVPPSGPERQSTLENMGYIYSRAAEVMIVLGDDTFSVIQEMLSKGVLSESSLQVLERDEWVSSVWTYQEIVNSESVRFVSERNTDDTSVFIKCFDFFNILGYSLSKWKQSTGSDKFATMRVFPNLNALEDLLADWMLGAYTCRSAFSIFSSMASKRNADPANYFYAILGALTQSSQQLTWDPCQNLAEKVMTICERKNDFSFIYTVAARDTDPRKRWRPQALPLPVDGATVPANLRPILAWNCWGEAQRGHHDASGFWLHGMTTMQLASGIENAGRDAIIKWLSEPMLQHADDSMLQHADDDVLGNAVYAVLARFGFEGEVNPTIVAEGLVFAQENVRRDHIVRVLVSNRIRWTMGAPALMHIRNGDEKQYLPCAYIGSIDRLSLEGETVLLWERLFVFM